MAYVKEADRNTAWYLFHKLYRCRVNPHHVRTIEEIKLYGTPTTGNEEYDREMMKHEDIVMISIAQMEDIFNNGYPVKIVDYNDSRDIYVRLTNHLVAMSNLFTGSENLRPNPELMDELIRLDKFAAAMFGTARYLIKEDVAHSPLKARMAPRRFAALGRKLKSQRDKPEEKPLQGIGRDYSTGQDLPREEPQQQREEPREDPNLPKRISLERIFENQKRFAQQQWDN